MHDDLVMMSIENGEYYGVGGVGPRVWELLEQPVTVEAITAVICDEFDVDADRCRQDIAAFVRQLLDTPCLEPRPRDLHDKGGVPLATVLPAPTDGFASNPQHPNLGNPGSGDAPWLFTRRPSLSRGVNGAVCERPASA